MAELATSRAPVGGSVRISYTLEDQAAAALMLSAALARRGIAHAYIGGFACALLGSERATQDIDVLLAHQGLDVPALRAELVRESPRFAQNTIKLFFISDSDVLEETDARTRLSRSKASVIIETLQAGSLGLPLKAEPTYAVPGPNGEEIHILAPSVLILTKLKRWFATWRERPSRPKTLSKMHSDELDLLFQLNWLVRNGRRIEPTLYVGKPRELFLLQLRAFHALFDAHHEGLLEAAMHEGDWRDMLALDVPKQVEDAPAMD